MEVRAFPPASSARKSRGAKTAGAGIKGGRTAASGHMELGESYAWRLRSAILPSRKACEARLDPRHGSACSFQPGRQAALLHE